MRLAAAYRAASGRRSGGGVETASKSNFQFLAWHNKIENLSPHGITHAHIHTHSILLLGWQTQVTV